MSEDYPSDIYAPTRHGGKTEAGNSNRSGDRIGALLIRCHRSWSISPGSLSAIHVLDLSHIRFSVVDLPKHCGSGQLRSSVFGSSERVLVYGLGSCMACSIPHIPSQILSYSLGRVYLMDVFYRGWTTDQRLTHALAWKPGKCRVTLCDHGGELVIGLTWGIETV